MGISGLCGGEGGTRFVNNFVWRVKAGTRHTALTEVFAFRLGITSA